MYESKCCGGSGLEATFLSCVHTQLLQSCPALCSTIAQQAPLSTGFSRQEYWSGLPCPPPGDLPNPEIEPASLTSPALADTFFTTSATWEAHPTLSAGNKSKQNPCLVQTWECKVSLQTLSTTPTWWWWGQVRTQWPLQLGWALPLLSLISPSPGHHPMPHSPGSLSLGLFILPPCLPKGSNIVIFHRVSSMFSQQSPPHFAQQANTSMYNNNMNINVSMATNTGGMNNMNQMTGQISMTSVTSVPTSGLSSMGPEQVSTPKRNHPQFLDCNFLSVSAIKWVFPCA